MRKNESRDTAFGPSPKGKARALSTSVRASRYRLNEREAIDAMAKF